MLEVFYELAISTTIVFSCWCGRIARTFFFPNVGHKQNALATRHARTSEGCFLLFLAPVDHIGDHECSNWIKPKESFQGFVIPIKFSSQG